MLEVVRNKKAKDIKKDSTKNKDRESKDKKEE